ncbi:mechanosensitive ion channel family protein [Sphaerothrix gracilis]|uniref:mechanosensitive ion channel family protein n=1 Tax=Sphaerothrix gracilis TaxID=3151835 RepID=UPI0031FD5981
MVHRSTLGKILTRRVTAGLLFVMTLLLALAAPAVTPAALPQSAVLMQSLGTASSQGSGSDYSLGWIGLDGTPVFQIAAPQSVLSQRQQRIEENLVAIRDNYLQRESPVATLTTSQTGPSEPISLYVNGLYLFTLTPWDAENQGMTLDAVERLLERKIPEALEQAYQQRQPEYLRRQAIVAVGLLLLAIAVVWALQHWREAMLRASVRCLSNTRLNQLSSQQQHHLRDIQWRLLPLVQGLILVGTALAIAGFFPQTRSLQNNFLGALKAPLVIGILILVSYVGIRLSYLLIDRFVTSLTDRDGFNDASPRRLQLRIETISSAVKNIANFVWIGIGLLVALAATGINLGVLLASFGLIGLAISLASQNLIKGAIQGFFIILEDQYAIGDVVAIDQDAGLVENMNLRITQLRDADGRLITIPTSDIDRVANYSLHWSRADLKLPVHYNADINQMIELARTVGQDLQDDPDWGELILEDPQILGVDDFGDSALIIRVWIKTQPLKQWDVSREYRRRFKLAMNETETSIPFPQQEIWLHQADSFTIESKNRSEKADSAAQRNGQGKTDAQPRNAPSEATEEAEPDT